MHWNPAAPGLLGKGAEDVCAKALSLQGTCQLQQAEIEGALLGIAFHQV